MERPGISRLTPTGMPTVHVKAGVTPDSLDSAYQSILKTIGDGYVRNAALIEDVAAENPAALADMAAVEKLAGRRRSHREDRRHAEPAKESVRYFFALLAWRHCSVGRSG